MNTRYALRCLLPEVNKHKMATKYIYTKIHLTLKHINNQFLKVLPYLYPKSNNQAKKNCFCTTAAVLYFSLVGYDDIFSSGIRVSLVAISGNYDLV